ncbi:hypothetical protein KBC40_00070 [Patescibacteria group bacterium]|nr:hypothetical protein [Patescibacteria group bacterium]
MKNHTSYIWMALIAIMTLITSNISQADADDSNLTKTNPDSSATMASWAPTKPEMAPWLVKWNNKGQPIKQYRLTFEVSNGDTVYYKGDCKIEDNRVCWYPKFTTAAAQQSNHIQWMGRRAMYAALGSAGYTAVNGYTPAQVDSLSRAIERVVNSKQDSRPMIAQIMANSPNAQRLLALEEKDKELDGRLQVLENKDWTPTPIDMNGFVGRGEFINSETRNSELWCMQDTMNTLLNTGLAAVDEQLSTTRGKRWEQMKVKHGVVQYFDFIQTLTVPKPVTEQISLSALPTTEQQPAKEKSKRGAMPRPHRH